MNDSCGYDSAGVWILSDWSISNKVSYRRTWPFWKHKRMLGRRGRGPRPSRWSAVEGWVRSASWYLGATSSTHAGSQTGSWPVADTNRRPAADRGRQAISSDRCPPGISKQSRRMILRWFRIRSLPGNSWNSGPKSARRQLRRAEGHAAPLRVSAVRFVYPSLCNFSRNAASASLASSSSEPEGSPAAAV